MFGLHSFSGQPFRDPGKVVFYAHERARIAIDEIVKIAVEKFLEAEQSIPGSKNEIVAAAFTNGWVKTAAQRNAEMAAANI